MAIAGGFFALCTVALATGSAQAANERLQRDPVLYELSLKGQPSGEHAQIINATVNYSNTTVGGPTYTRVLSDCATPSGVGVGVNYHVQPFTVDATGAYDVTSVQDGGWDGYLFVYQNAFDPLNPATNCLAGNDDGVGGIGTSDILGVALTAGTPYLAVTTGFEPADSGTFTNTITGPGNIALGGAGPQADLNLSKTAPGGVVLGGPFVYSLGAGNAGPDPATAVTVTDTLPAGVSFVSSSCGASEAGGTVTWNIGNLANGAAANCDITVTVAGSVCPAISNTASISGAEGDPSLANNSATSANGGGNLVADPGFETGTPNAAWAEASTNFGTPICDAAGCGVGGGTGPHSGTFWTWFGGFGGGVESGSVSQSLTIPAGSTDISFWAEFPACEVANGANDFVRLTIDGSEVWREDANSARCNVVGYSLVTIPLGAFADGAAHSISFESTTVGGTATNFFIDDVAILSAPACGTAGVLLPAVLVPSLNGLGLLGLGLALGIGGLLLIRVRGLH
ncbi:MAG: DUF11 domain-containing protein [Lysobacterales bacterium]